jgi:hypothetical protein
MRTTAAQLAQLERISAQISSLNAERARIDAELAQATEELRALFTDRILQSQDPASSNSRTNLADTTTATEIACLLRISERTAHRLVQHSALLVNHHPRTLDALHTGVISWAHTTTLLHEYAGLPHGIAAGIENALLLVAMATSVPRLSYRARRLRARLHPVALDDRARTATERRRVDVEPADDAMAWLHIHLPAVDAAAIDTRLTSAARHLQTPGEHRTLPQIRTDVLTDLLLGDRNPMGSADHTQGCRVRAIINVTVPVLTLLGVDDAPADLEGYGPIPAETAGRLVAHAPCFTRLLIHPETGVVLSVGRTTYAVPADLKRWLRVRDRTCRHPGCTIPASRCELDHTKPWSQQGTTAEDNLAHLCRNTTCSKAKASGTTPKPATMPGPQHHPPAGPTDASSNH